MSYPAFKTLLEMWGQPASTGPANPTTQPPAMVARYDGFGTGGTKERLSAIVNNPNYVQFVQQLGQHINDPKVQNLLNAGREDGNPDDEKVKFQMLDLPVRQLLPTQNEIGLENSLKFPLAKKPQNVARYLNGGVLTVGNGKIVTAGGGKYVIDGHHRWSEVYCINPDASIAAVDMSNLSDPTQALKVAQMSVAATTGNVKIERASGGNMLTMSREQIKQYVLKTCSQASAQAFQENQNNQRWLQYRQKHQDLMEAIAEFITDNCMTLQQNNQPVVNAPPRDFMPQTGDALGWATKLGQGKINFKRPLVAGEWIKRWGSQVTG